MQEKKIRTFIRVILALFIIGFAYSLSFTFLVNKKENQIKKQYTGNNDEVKKELDDLYNDDHDFISNIHKKTDIEYHLECGR